jgi:hypothetical protein
MNGPKRLMTGSAAAFACLLAGSAHGQTTIPNCNDTTLFPNPVYLTGSSAFEPTIALMAVPLSKLATGNVTLIYKATSSCDGPTAIQGNTTLTGSADFWTANVDPTKPAVKSTCSLDAAVTKADLGVSDIFYENCPGNALPLPATLTDIKGPVQAMIFIVKESTTPVSNTTTESLTAEEARDIWGCGMTGAVEPYTIDADIQQRNAGSGTQGVVAKAIGVPPGSFKSTIKMNAAGGDLVTSLLNAPDPGSAIGFLAADSYDTKTTTLNALAFRGFGQTKAYYADSVLDGRDKKNVRDGHYLVWGPEHFFATVDATTKALTNAKAADLIGWINGTKVTTAFNYVDVEATAGVVPQCAMQVTRDTDGGPLRYFTPAEKPAEPCGCRFESTATGVAAPTGCTPCPLGTECGAGKSCHNKFCE